MKNKTAKGQPHFYSSRRHWLRGQGRHHPPVNFRKAVLYRKGFLLFIHKTMGGMAGYCQLSGVREADFVGKFHSRTVEFF